MRIKILFIFLTAFGSLILMAPVNRAQTPTPSPSGSETETTFGGYKVTSSIELGARSVDVNGFRDKFRSDFNYRSGFRVFDSSFLMEAKEGEGKLFDSLLVTSSGWNADPTGYFRANVEKMGVYQFDAKVRRVNHFNRLNNHARGHRPADTQRDFGDFDFTVFPQNENFRLRLGYSYSRTDGTTGFSTRPFSDEFPVTAVVDLKTQDLRAGVEGKAAGFKMSFLYGFRRFKDDTIYTIFEPNQGNNTTNTAVLTAFERLYPIRGDTTSGMFTVQRTFARKLDFTGRFIYAVTDRRFRINETVIGRDASNNFIDPDRFFFRGDSKRMQSRGDIGLTYAFTDNFRLSNTFTFDQFRVTGDSRLAQETFSRTAAGVARPTTFANTFYYRLNGYRRFSNTIDADYQFSHRLGVNFAYRHTRRRVDIEGFNRPLAPSTSAPTLIGEEEENATNTFLFGTRIKPVNNWSIFADVEHGEADNAFTRLSNYNFTNYRIRSNWNYRQFTFNVSAIVRNNENPSQTSAITSSTGAILVPAGELLGNVKSKIFSGFVDWSPDPRFSLSTGYTYHHLTSQTDIVVPLAVLTPGFSEYYMRDNYAFIDVSAQPFKRVSIFASYRFDNDRGQGDRVPTAPQFIISSYPYQLKMPEVRVAIRLTRNIDWNIGYQYFDYRENLTNASPPPFPPFTTPATPLPPPQNYNAHMPYTSLRIYFGRKE